MAFLNNSEPLYDHLQISTGMDASTAFYNLPDETDAAKVLATREALLKYCCLDTFDMVKLLEKLYEVTGNI